MHGRAFYDAVGDALTGFLPPSLRDFRCHRSSVNLKCWYADAEREHYEVQLIKWKQKIGLEIGFHAEHKDAARNADAVARLMASETSWRKALGAEPEAGAFIGYQSKVWTRISEFWDGAQGGDDPDLAIDAADRLASYITTFEPLRTR
jgi:hypothetical protein